MRLSPRLALAGVVLLMILTAVAAVAVYGGARALTIQAGDVAELPPFDPLGLRPSPTPVGVVGAMSATPTAIAAAIPAVAGSEPEPTPASQIDPAADYSAWADPNRVNILLLGIDQRRGEEGPFRTDTMIVLSLDPVRRSGVMLSIPRDLWVSIPGFAPGRINTANSLGDSYSFPGGGPALAWGQGVSAYQAFHPVSRGTSRFIHPPAWFTERELRAQAAEALHRQPEEYDLYRAYGGRGLRQTFGEPFTTAGILLAKAVVTIGAWPVPDALSPSFEASRHARPFAYLSWSFAVLLALGAAGFLARRGTGDRTAGTLLAGLVVVGAANLIGPASAAARQPALPLLAAFGGAWLAGHLPAQRGRGGARSRGALLGFGAALAVSVLAALLSPVRVLRNPSEDLRLTAATFVQTQAWRQAVPLLEEAVRSDPANVEARLALASAYQADALPSAATQQLEAAYAADSTYAGVLFALARDRHEANRVEEALALLERLVSSHPNHPVYLRELAGMHTQAQNYARAEPLLQQAVRLDPQDQVASEALQQIVSLRLRLESALFPEEARLQEDPEFNAAIPRVVDAMEAGRWAEADSILDWAERERPTMALTSWLRGGYLARRGDLRGAAAALERCQQIAPGRPAVVAQLAKLYAQTGRRERIEPLLRSSLVAVGADSMAARQLRELMREIGIR